MRACFSAMAGCNTTCCSGKGHSHFLNSLCRDQAVGTGPWHTVQKQHCFFALQRGQRMPTSNGKGAFLPVSKHWVEIRAQSGPQYSTLKGPLSACQLFLYPEILLGDTKSTSTTMQFRNEALGFFSLLYAYCHVHGMPLCPEIHTL